MEVHSYQNRIFKIKMNSNLIKRTNNKARTKKKINLPRTHWWWRWWQTASKIVIMMMHLRSWRHTRRSLRTWWREWRLTSHRTASSSTVLFAHSAVLTGAVAHAIRRSMIDGRRATSATAIRRRWWWEIVSRRHR